jgi:uncharacterized protein YjeT (DUF2065 family)
MNEHNPKWMPVFCWAGFIITSGAGLMMFLAPAYMSKLIEIASLDDFFIKLLGLILVAVGVCYFMALYDEDAARSLIFIASGEKVLAVLYSLGSLVGGKVGSMILGVIIVDAILAGIGIYVAINLSRTLWTDDNMEEGK